MGIRLGAAFPSGDVAKGEKLSDGIGPQIMLVWLDIGLKPKPMPNFFFGAIFALGVGPVGDRLQTLCKGASCFSYSNTGRFLIEVQYHVLPAARVNPWLGYGIGLDLAIARFEVSEERENPITGETESASHTVENTVFGPSFAHFMAGVDFRLKRTLGVGPFVDFSIGQYTSATSESNGVKVERSIDNPATHYWLSGGARFVINP